ncbi:MAG: phosphoribosylanthranilate isomerase [Candidatus Pelagibacter sp.]|nr:phosphoribosylanthranilate isomerase [Pelagibacterales bacterium SAG-MED23]
MIKGIKICGISDLETLKYILNHKYPPKFIGFISNYKKSKRYVNYQKLKKLTDIKKNKTNYVCVLVKPEDEELEKIKDLNFDYYQLYDVSPARSSIIKEKYNVKIISAMTIKDKNDVDNYKNYIGISDIILFDGKGYEKSFSFDHKLLNSVPNSINKMIAGNIKIEDIPNLKKKDIFVDLSGALESKEGKKDIAKINELLNLGIK